jgi:hypothetical protein
MKYMQRDKCNDEHDASVLHAKYYEWMDLLEGGLGPTCMTILWTLTILYHSPGVGRDSSSSQGFLYLP